ncbi:MAG: hypothetical protein N2317_04195 [Syntrophales bacterium]|nr:hypothetical protein [Syntrophales bacterium]
MILVLYVTGLVTLLSQVVLLRELTVTFYGVEFIYLVSIAFWLLWGGIGATLSRRVLLPTPGTLPALLLAFTIVLPVVIVFIRGTRPLLGIVPGSYMQLHTQVIVAALSLLPVAIISGPLFTIATRNYLDARKEKVSIARAYAIECAGGLTAGILATITLSLGIQNLQLGIICTLTTAVTGTYVSSKSPLNQKYLPIFVLLTASTLGLATYTTSLDFKMTKWNHPRLLTSQDTPYGRISVTQYFSQLTIFENDALTTDTETPEGEIPIHLSALQHPNPKHVLLLGGGTKGYLKEILKHKPIRIDYVELDKKMMDILIPLLPEDIAKSFVDPRVKITFTDPRRFLKSAQQYDLIIIGMPEPSSGSTNRFYTEEFFRLCAASLKENGVLSLSLRGGENFWTPLMMMKMQSIIGALRSVFSEVEILPGTVNVILASPTRFPATYETLITRLHERNIRGKFLNPDYIRYIYTNDRYEAAKNMSYSSAIPINRDIQPICYRFALLVWLSKFLPELNKESFIPALEKHIILWFTLILILTSVLPLFLALRRLGSVPLLIAFYSGMMSMVMETILLLYYQVKAGVLFRDVGLLLTSFMGGLTFGAWAGENLREKHHIIVLLLLNPVFLIGTHIFIYTGVEPEIITTLVLLGTGGFFSGILFALASTMTKKNGREAVFGLYGTDLLGGCVGSILCCAFLIPFLGLDTTMLYLILLSLFPLTAVTLRKEVERSRGSPM